MFCRAKFGEKNFYTLGKHFHIYSITSLQEHVAPKCMYIYLVYVHN